MLYVFNFKIMRTRKQLAKLVKQNNKVIERLEKQNIDLLHESYLLCDKRQFYTEKDELITMSHKPIVKKMCKVGYINWTDTFIDMDTEQKIKVKRSRRVKVDDVWL